jgi:hypothetical protein
VIKKPRGRGGHSPRWAAKPEKIINNNHMKILLGDFNAKVGKENIFKPIIGNESLHQDSNNKWGENSKLCHIQKSSC